MKTKIIPFDLETAKKIQAGEIEGRIVAKGVYDGETVKESEIREIRFDINCKSYPIAAIYEGNFGEETVGQFDKNGINSNPYLHKLFIELPEETPKHEFKPFDKVLVRHPDKTELCVSNNIWLPGIFQYKSVNSNLYFVSGKSYKDCIPYEGNEYLVGTADKPKKD